MTRLKIHLLWALVASAISLGWGRWTSIRHESTIREREQALEAMESRLHSTPQAPVPPQEELRSDRRTPSVMAPEAPVSEEDLVSGEVRRLMRSTDRKERWEAARVIDRILVPRLRRALLDDLLASPDETLRM